MASLQVGVIPAEVAETRATVAGLGVRYLRAGEGPTLVFLHDSLGNIGWVPLFDQLAHRFDVVVPDLAGYGQSDRPEWARSPRDLAILTLQLVDQLGGRDIVLVGIGFGGFVAAEMATMAPGLLARLVLLGPVGIKPREGEIADQMLRGCVRYGAAGFRDGASFKDLFGADNIPDELFRLWDFSTEMTARVCWKPAMFSLELPHLLAGVAAPTLVLFGEHDQIVPIDVGRQYAERLPNARLEIVADAGHWIDLETPDLVADAIARFA
ncbi:MAG: alpha/beta hydrolase [Acidimicrobiia bacterium]|nr:alpha/beta hydrolase [Acidimicrobiia bacterium]MDH5238095.1 alpha/beta hydrolase [Acidimicrobiia bacterium]